MEMSDIASVAVARDGLILVRDVVASGADPRALRTALDKGLLVRVRRGAYFDAGHWGALSSRGRYGVLVRATALALPHDRVLSHQSAAALWELPIIGTWPTRVHVTAPRSAGGRSTPGVIRHEGTVDDGVRLPDGSLVTSIARTLIDLARTSSFASTVTAMDHALHLDEQTGRSLVSTAELADQLDRMVPFRGSVAAFRAMSFANGLSGSVGESLSRVRMQELRFPPPILQHAFVDREGSMVVDFWWPEFNLIGEFDGMVKYHRPEFMSGRAVEGVVVDEKRREDRLRRLGPRVARWTWDEAYASRPLGSILTSAGLHRRTR